MHATSGSRDLCICRAIRNTAFFESVACSVRNLCKAAFLTRSCVAFQIFVKAKTDGTLNHSQMSSHRSPPPARWRMPTRGRVHTNWRGREVSAGPKRCRTVDSLWLKKFLVRTRQELVNSCQFLASSSLTVAKDDKDSARQRRGRRRRRKCRAAACGWRVSHICGPAYRWLAKIEQNIAD